MSVTVGSLFSGIGGLDLGLERAGMNVIWQSEIDPYACRVLAKHWPTIPNHGDIKTIDWAQIERPNIICGGYPCQPFSVAGKRAGTEDPRHLWPWVREAISHLRPDFAILENVRGHLSMGLATVLGEMSEIGYDAEWEIISASSLGASHRRERLFILAYPSLPDMEKSKVVASEKRLPKQSRRNAARSRMAEWPADEPNLVGMAYGVSEWVDRSRSLGNAVVPQVAEFVGRRVMECYQ